MEKAFFALALAAMTTIEAYASPSISDVTMEQNADRTIKISYTLSSGPAIVTLDIQTNGVSIGGKNIANYYGDVSKVVDGGSREITWYAYRSWPGHDVAGAKAVLTAWPKSDPPDYMVVDLAVSPIDRIRYYTSEDRLPGGLLDNPRYRVELMVMRRIRATGIPWTMGAFADEARLSLTDQTRWPHDVTFTNDWYMGVFEVTQGQWGYAYDYPTSSYFRVEWPMRPRENLLFYEEVRGGEGYGGDGSNMYPAAPASSSFLGALRLRTGVKFDLPGESMWEYACRGGCYGAMWNNGKPYQYSSSGERLAYDTNYEDRNKFHSGIARTGDENYGTSDETYWTSVNGTAKVGSYPPNAFGLYDMQGNVAEWCLDWFDANITANAYGQINANGLQTGTGAAISDATKHVVRGGSWSGGALDAIPTIRTGYESRDGTRYNNIGIRLVCPCPAE